MKLTTQDEKEEGHRQVLNKFSEIGIDEVGRGAVFGPIFSAAVVPIAVMGVVLELGKLVTASWLYHYWRRVPNLLKSYLISSSSICAKPSSLICGASMGCNLTPSSIRKSIAFL